MYKYLWIEIKKSKYFFLFPGLGLDQYKKYDPKVRADHRT